MGNQVQAFLIHRQASLQILSHYPLPIPQFNDN